MPKTVASTFFNGPEAQRPNRSCPVSLMRVDIGHVLYRWPWPKLHDYESWLPPSIFHFETSSEVLPHRGEDTTRQLSQIFPGSVVPGSVYPRAARRGDTSTLQYR